MLDACGEKGVELEGKAFHLSVNLFSNLTCGHELRVVTGRMRLWIKEANVTLLSRTQP